MDGRQPCHLAEPDGTSDLAREQACPGGLCHGHFTSLSIHYWTLLRLGLCFFIFKYITKKREKFPLTIIFIFTFLSKFNLIFLNRDRISNNNTAKGNNKQR